MSERLDAARRKVDLALSGNMTSDQKIIFLAIAVDRLIGEIVKLRTGLGK